MLNNIELFEKCLQNKVASIDYTSKDIRNKIVLPDNENNIVERRTPRIGWMRGVLVFIVI